MLERSIAFLFAATAWAAVIAASTAMVASILFLRTRNFFYDALALAVTEIGLALLAAGIVAGAIAGHMAAGLWWTWDARLTAGLVCWLLYAPYLMLRAAIEEPTRRASAAAVVSIFAFFDAPLAVVAVHWWLTRHAATPRIWTDGTPPARWWNVLPVVLLGAALSGIRLRREQRRRAMDAERRSSQTI
jgi:heme exporter protein C